ncbi:NADPH-dependent FMN reductase [Krasilnikoviella flava]|uniref:FMN reductase n=1 Tax=Krasilnikoviella flava TaxID=526729 RepID=A0A1T5L783_9MICO|nr:NAD(P)H-dependent oxidoreductase [Krasilnikoviella flava]SKC71793.1 FMN reductase [Krasilnikoviella flava]
MTAPTRPATPSVVVVSGNPREGSRTLAAAEAAGRRIAELLGAPGPDIGTIELAAFAGELLTATHPEADEAKERLARATVAVVATPVYKASYTGLLKAFLDLYGPDGLAGVVVVPLVVSGNPAHALAGEVHLRPVLVELGAVVPTRTLALTEAQLPELGAALDPWFARWATPLRRAAGAATTATPTETPELTGAVL